MPDPKQQIRDDLRSRLKPVSIRLAKGIKPTTAQCRWMYGQILDMTEALERSMEVKDGEVS